MPKTEVIDVTRMSLKTVWETHQRHDLARFRSLLKQGYETCNHDQAVGFCNACDAGYTGVEWLRHRAANTIGDIKRAAQDIAHWEVIGCELEAGLSRRVAEQRAVTARKRLEGIAEWYSLSL